MRTIITTIVLAITMLYTGQAQSHKQIKNWITSTVADDQGVSAISNDGEIIKGVAATIDGKSAKPIIWYNQYLGDDGRVKLRISIGYTNYRHDTSGEDKNYLSVEVIGDGDKSTKLKFSGKVYNESGYIEIRNIEADGFATPGHLYNMLLKHKDIYVKLGDNYVYKFSAIGFKDIDTFGENLLKNKSAKNPFSETSSDNPFKG